MKPGSSNAPPPSPPSAVSSPPHISQRREALNRCWEGKGTKAGTLPSPPRQLQASQNHASPLREHQNQWKRNRFGASHPPTHLSRQSCRSTKVDGNVVPPRSAKSAVPPKGIPPSNILTIGKTAVPLRSTETLFHHGSVSRGTISAFLPAPKDSLYTSI